MENKNLALNLEQAFICEKDLVSRKNQDGTVILMKLDDSSVFYKINGFASILWGVFTKTYYDKSYTSNYRTAC